MHVSSVISNTHILNYWICIDLTNTLRIILEQSVEGQAIVYVTFIDSEKAFDSVKREVMWRTLQECGAHCRNVAHTAGMWRTLQECGAHCRNVAHTAGMWRTLQECGYPNN
jgi:hypothetical protein